MSPDRDPSRLGDDHHETDARDDDSPRSIFSALWFRALLTVLVLGVLAAVAVPYVLDLATAPKLMATPAKSGAVAPAAPETATPATATSTPAPADTAAPATATESSSSTPPSPSGTAAAAGEPPAPAAAKSKTSTPAATKSRTVVAKAAEPPKPQAKAAEAEKPAPKAAETTKPAPAKTGSGGPYWVQVGAFKDPETAKRLAARLREQGLRVEESTTTAAGPRASATPAAAPRAADRYDVVVSGASAADVDAKLAPKGLKGEATANGVVVRPSLALREAVALSRDLADAGLSVQVRRIGGPAPAPTPVPAAPTTLHRVRVGGFPDRAAAVDAMKRLEDKGLKPFLARGSE